MNERTKYSNKLNLPVIYPTSIVLSFGLHFLFLSILTHKPDQVKITPKIITVLYEPAPNFKKLMNKDEIKMVSPSKAEVKLPSKTNNLSDKNYATKTEQVKRGDGLEYGRSVAKKSSKKSSTTKKTPKKTTSTQKLDLTIPSRFTTLNKVAKSKPESSSIPSPTAQPFSRSDGSQAQFLGLYGNSDFLPNIKDGDITLLNAKADKFAVFVRRVAVQVFHQVKQESWQSLTRGEVRSISNFVYINAILDKSGNLVSTNLQKGSGSARFDSLIKQAIKKSARDPHPPTEALADDGQYHFIFKARSWSRVSASSNGGFSERRWLVLGTGLK